MLGKGCQIPEPSAHHRDPRLDSSRRPVRSSRVRQSHGSLLHGQPLSDPSWSAMPPGARPSPGYCDDQLRVPPSSAVGGQLCLRNGPSREHAGPSGGADGKGSGRNGVPGYLSYLRRLCSRDQYGSQGRLAVPHMHGISVCQCREPNTTNVFLNPLGAVSGRPDAPPPPDPTWRVPRTQWGFPAGRGYNELWSV